MGRKRKRRRRKRGYPVAVLVALEERAVHLWDVFSERTKPYRTLRLGRHRHEPKRLYKFHEAVVDLLRPRVHEGLKSVILATPPNADYAGAFRDHLEKHHRWLVQRKARQRVALGEVEGHARDQEEVDLLVASPAFQEVVEATTAREGDRLLSKLDRLLQDPELDPERDVLVLFTLREVERVIYRRWDANTLRPAYLLVTDEYLESHPRKGRVYRVMQVARNKGVKTRVLEVETDPGQRLQSMNGIACFSEYPAPG